MRLLRVGAVAQLAAQLTPAERLRLVERIIRDLADAANIAEPCAHGWQQLRGQLPYPALGENAQAWISRSRGESDEQRQSLIT